MVPIGHQTGREISSKLSVDGAVVVVTVIVVVVVAVVVVAT